MAFTERTFLFFRKTVRVPNRIRPSSRHCCATLPLAGAYQRTAGDILISRTGPDCVRRTQSVGRPTSRRHRVNAPAARICARRSAAHTGARLLSRIVLYRRRVRARVFYVFFFSLFACPTPIIKTPAHVRYTYYSCVPSVINRRCHTRLAPTVRPS